jgi:hypothetical protein
MDSVTGAAVATMVVLGYVLVVQAMTAAIVLLAEFSMRRVRALRFLLAMESQPEPATTSVEPQGQEPAYRIGGGLLKW